MIKDPSDPLDVYFDGRVTNEAVSLAIDHSAAIGHMISIVDSRAPDDVKYRNICAMLDKFRPKPDREWED